MRLTLLVLFLRPGFTKYTATCPFCVLWPTLPSNLPESTLSVSIMDCSTTPLSILSSVSEFVTKGKETLSKRVSQLEFDNVLWTYLFEVLNLR